MIMNKLLYLRQRPIETVIIVYLFFVGLIGLPIDAIGNWFGTNSMEAGLYGTILCRFFSSIVMLLLCKHMGLARYPKQDQSILKCFFILLPAFFVVINNAPIIALCRGTAGVTESAHAVVLFLLQCFCVAFFEEISFRGIIFPLLLQSCDDAKFGKWTAAVVSSGLFGITHFLNLMSGAALGAVVLQAGYSFLIGAMLSVVMYCFGNVWLCVLLHAVFNFGGMLVQTLGYGTFINIWNLPTIIITIVLALAAIVFYTIIFSRNRGTVIGQVYKLSMGQRVGIRFSLANE